MARVSSEMGTSETTDLAGVRRAWSDGGSDADTLDDDDDADGEDILVEGGEGDDEEEDEDDDEEMSTLPR